MMHKLSGNSLRQVWLDGEFLDPAPSQKIRNHSPDGFNWGYGGSGPSQLALAIVLKLTGKTANYQDLKWKIIAGLPKGRAFDISFEYPETIESK